MVFDLEDKMNINEKFSELIDQFYTIEKIVNDLEKTPRSYGTEQKYYSILTICQILDIEDIYEAFLGENPFDHIMENLNEDGKAKIIEFANLLRASRKSLPHRADIIPFENYQPIAVEPASAGTGNYIEDCLKESYNVGHLAPEKTDFGIRISGDSMEPMYHTGDVAWVHKQDSISNGEIGIFCLNGNTYIKELHDGPDGVYLVSLKLNSRLLSCSC